jgi:hypothetical protein
LPTPSKWSDAISQNCYCIRYKTVFDIISENCFARKIDLLLMDWEGGRGEGGGGGKGEAKLKLISSRTGWEEGTTALSVLHNNTQFCPYTGRIV